MSSESTSESARPARARFAWTALLALLYLSGCDGEPPDSAVIDRTRVLGVRVEVEGEPGRVSPLPGESMNVRLFVVAPDPDPALAFALRACVATDSVSALVSCDGEPLAEAASLEPLPDAPSVSFEAPEMAGNSGRLAVVGAVCPAGVALVSAGADGCADGSWVLGVTTDFPMDDGTAPNTNPAFTAVYLDGAELAAETASETDCAALPTVTSASAGHAVRVELEPSSRDPLPVVTSADPPQESLLVSWFTTRGVLDNAYSSIDSSAADTVASVAWNAPIVGETSLTRLFVVVRDGRGGSDFLERRVCVTP